MDGFAGYKSAAAEELPDAVPVMDPFHVVALAGSAKDGLWPSFLFAVATAGSLFAGPLSRRIFIEGKSLTKILSAIMFCEAIFIFPCGYLYKGLSPF